MSDSVPAPAAVPPADLPADGRVAWGDPVRRTAFGQWLSTIAPRHGLDAASLAPASADASFRRCLRVAAVAGSRIVMDAPPPLEDTRPFVQVAALLAGAGLHVPRVLEAEVEQGFLLLDDLGTEPYLTALQAAQAAGDGARADRLMRDAIAALVTMQRHADARRLPPFDEALLRRELELFPVWCVAREHGIAWGDGERRAWQGLCDVLVASALAQPVVAVHADWMPRNLMVCGGPGSPGNPGVLDFQDAVAGPVSYDIASLLRDAFLSWPEEQEIDWAVRWWQAARKAGVPVAEDFGECWRALEWMGLQRHLKVLGIFCRLKHRDGKAGYAADLPRFFGYATRVALRYRPLAPLLKLLEPMSERTVAAGYTF
jgi:aminoglycoside/choline kinase family phosphotransferase